MQPRRLGHRALQVSDMQASKEWYQRVFGLQQVYEAEWQDHPAMMVMADGTGFALFPSGTVTAHTAVDVDSDQFEAWKGRLTELGIAFDYEDHGPTHSMYFSDPDGHRLEITSER